MSPYPTVKSLPLYPPKHLIVQRSMTKTLLKVLFIWDHAIGIFKKFSKTLILSKVQNALTMQTHVFLSQLRDSNGRTLSTEKHEYNVRRPVTRRPNLSSIYFMKQDTRKFMLQTYREDKKGISPVEIGRRG